MRKAFGWPRHMVRRSRTVAFLRFSETVTGSSSENASTSRSSRESSPSFMAMPTAAEVKLLLAE